MSVRVAKVLVVGGHKPSDASQTLLRLGGAIASLHPNATLRAYFPRDLQLAVLRRFAVRGLCISPFALHRAPSLYCGQANDPASLR
jgi:hypothetical protein